MSWEQGSPVAIDLYYDPVVDEHVGRGPMGIIAPAWYFAPQRPVVAEKGWQTAAAFAGLGQDGPVAGLDNPASAVMLLQLAGEFADEATRARLWAAAEPHIEPTWDGSRGEFTLGFGLGEAHPRGQLNARAMAGWVATPGAWSRIFNQPKLAKFQEPTVEGVDFPNVALSEAYWDGAALHLTAQPMREADAGRATTVKLTNVDPTTRWEKTRVDGGAEPLRRLDDGLEIPLLADGRPTLVRPG